MVNILCFNDLCMILKIQCRQKFQFYIIKKIIRITSLTTGASETNYIAENIYV